MLQKLKQILLTQYIGAIVMAIVVAQAVQTLVNLTIEVVWHWVVVWRTPAGLLGESQNQDLDWRRLIFTLVNILLNAAVVCGLMRWLYFGHQSGALPEGPEPEPPAPDPTSSNA